MLDKLTLLFKKSEFKTPGMRIIKTSLAIIICFMIDYLRGYAYPYNCAITAIICMQQNLPNAKSAAKNRIYGTFFSGIYSISVIYFLTKVLSMELNSFFYFISIGVLVVPLMTLLVNLGLEKSILVATVIYILCCITSLGNKRPIMYMLFRVVDSTLGILVSLFINWLPILNRANRE